MPKLPAGSIDLVVTSPPYDAEKAYEGRRDIESYRLFAANWTAEVPRTLTDNGQFWLNVGYTKTGANETLPLTYLYHEVIRGELGLIQEIVWHYEGGMSYKRRFTHRTERWQWFAKQPDNITFNLDDVRDISLNKTIDKRNNPLGKNPTDYWYFDRVAGGTAKSSEKTAHPCQFPIKMIDRVVKASSNFNETVLDPFTGSGTTGVACAKLGRRFIGIEQDPDYFRIACDRIRQAYD